MISAFICLVHRHRLQEENKVLEQEKRSIADIDIDIEGGNMKYLDAVEEKRSSMLR
jgi:hypothetical protein